LPECSLVADEVPPSSCRVKKCIPKAHSTSPCTTTLSFIKSFTLLQKLGIILGQSFTCRLDTPTCTNPEIQSSACCPSWQPARLRWNDGWSSLSSWSVKLTCGGFRLLIGSRVQMPVSRRSHYHEGVTTYA
jgi:hypothetical protein